MRRGSVDLSAIKIPSTALIAQRSIGFWSSIPSQRVAGGPDKQHCRQTSGYRQAAAETGDRERIPAGNRLPGRRMKRILVALVALFVVLAAACGSGGLPDKDGTYPVQSHSVSWDGNDYRFAWADNGGTLHQAQTRDVKLVQDDQTFLQMQNHDGVLHLASTESVSVLGRDQYGQYSDSWFPFLAGATLGNALGGLRTPGYYYPPTNQYGRGDQIDGSVSTNSPKPPDYSTIRTPPNAVHPAPGSVAGQSSGTGGGNAASNKLGGNTAGNAAGSVGGQAGGTGNGSAAGSKAGSAPQGGGSNAPRSGGGSSAPRTGGGSAPRSGGGHR
jgi:hypothetical protein